MELTNFAEALEALIESGAENYGDCESMEELERLSSRFEAFRTEATSAFEAGGGGGGVGGRRGQDGGIVALGALSCLTGRRQAPGPSGTDAAPPARSHPGLARGVYWHRSGQRHCIGPASPH